MVCMDSFPPKDQQQRRARPQGLPPKEVLVKTWYVVVLWNMFKNCRIHGAVIVEDIVEMRSEDFHVLGGIGRLVPVRESHCHLFVILLWCAVSPFRKETDVLLC
jgi:hypothetical protein